MPKHQEQMKGQNAKEFDLKKGDPIVERRHCQISGTAFPLFQSDKVFFKKILSALESRKERSVDDILPKISPEERWKQRLQFRNERALYRRKCDATGQQVISVYHEDGAYTVYDQELRRGDGRDPSHHGKDVDFSKPFFEQFVDLQRKVPRPALLNTRTENGKYSNFSGDNKDVYMTFASWDNELVMHSKRCYNSSNCIDMLHCYYCEFCYDCTHCKNCYDLQFSLYCDACNRSAYCSLCINCNDCLFCDSLVGAQYMIHNKQYTKEEYLTIKKAILSSHEERKKHEERREDESRSQESHENNLGSENVKGRNIYDSKNCWECQSVEGCEDCKYGTEITYSKDCQDMDYCIKNCECLYDYIGGTDSHFSARCVSSFFNSHIFYCDLVMYSHHCFGCVGLKNKSYCILNKQYTKHEYEELVAKIIDHMVAYNERGSFFPLSCSPFSYNETVAMEHFPLTSEQASVGGKKRRTREETTAHEKAIQAAKIPYDIMKISDNYLSAILICEKSAKPYRIIKSELSFYRKHNIPLPRTHPDTRHQQRIERCT